MLIIKSQNGTYWNDANECFGPIQAATLYERIDDLPDFINDACIDIHSTPDKGGFLDIRYYVDDSIDSIASVESKEGADD